MKYLFPFITALFVFSCASAPPPETFSVSLDSRHHKEHELDEPRAGDVLYAGAGGKPNRPVQPGIPAGPGKAVQLD